MMMAPEKEEETIRQTAEEAETGSLSQGAWWLWRGKPFKG